RIGNVEPFAGNAYRGTDNGNVSFGKFHVDGRSGHLDHFAFVHMQFLFGLDMSSPYSSADAPLTISIISRVILAWRTRFINSVSSSITSLAFLVAASIATMRAACSAATDSRNAR